MFESFSYLYIITLSLSLSMIVILLFVNINDIKKVFSGIRKTTWIMLLVIFVLSLLLIHSFPNMLHTSHDEYYYGNCAKDIIGGKVNFHLEKSVAYPFLISFFFLVFGSDLGVSYSINLFFGAASTIVIFLITYLLFGKQETALYSALLLALFPLHIIFSCTMESNISAVFFAMFSVFCFLFYFKNRTFFSQMLASFSLVFAVHFRLEFVLLCLLSGIMVLLFDTGLRKEFRSIRYWIPWIFAIILLIPWNITTNYFATLPSEENPHSYGYYQHILSYDALSDNLYFSGNLIMSHYNPSYLALFLFAGLFYLLINERKVFLFLSLYILVFVAVYLSFEGQQIRLFLIAYNIIIILWARGISYAEDFIKGGVLKDRVIRFSLAIPITIMLLLSLSFLPVFSVALEEDKSIWGLWGLWDYREPHLEREAVFFMSQNLDECTIVMVDTEALVTRNLNPVTIEDFLDNPMVFEEETENGCLLFFDDLYCEVPGAFYYDNETIARYNRLCREMRETFELELYKEFEIKLPDKYQAVEPAIIEEYSYKFRLYKIISVDRN